MKILDLDQLDLSSLVGAGDRVMWGQAGAEPLPLTRALFAQRRAIGRFCAFIGASWFDSVKPEWADAVRFESYCGAAENRKLAKAGVLEIVPSHYSQLPRMIRDGRLKVDVLLLQVAPADRHGRYSLSIAHEYLLAALDTARVVAVEINHRAPRTFGERSLAAEDIDVAIVTDRDIVPPPAAQPSVAEHGVARRVADLIEDGCTLQMGIGTLPEAVLRELGNRRDLGVHTGALTDQIAVLARAGVITNARKSIDRGVTVAGVMMGGRTVYDFAHDNESVCFRSVEYTHSQEVLAGIDRFVALNSAVEVDLTGQINAEVAGGFYVGAVGGALDFLRGAGRSKGGLPIVALPSTTGKLGHPISRIVAELRGPVSTPRADAGLIVTEHGVADLRGLSITQRIDKMLAIADPQFQPDLQLAVGRGPVHGHK